MNQPTSLERMVAAWMADEAPPDPADQLTERILTATARARPLPHWLALLRESPMTTQTRVLVGSPTRRLAFVAILLMLAALGAALIAGAILLRPQSTADDWLGFRGGPSHDGVGLTGPIGSPVTRWTFDAHGAVKNNIAVASGIVLVPSEDGALHGLSLVDGSERWVYRPGTSLTGPAVGGGLAYVTDGEGFVHAVDVATGTVRWSSEGAHAGASPASVGGGAVLLGTGDGRIVALDAVTGRSRWATPIAAAGDALGSPAYADGLVYAAASSAGVVALEASTGKVAWQFDLDGDPVGTIVVTGGIVYAGVSGDAGNGRLRAIDARTGTLRWQVDEPLFSPSIAGSLAISGSNTGVITARDVATGEERWRFLTDGTNRPPAIAGGIAYVAADGQQRIYALDVLTGELVWQVDVDGENQCCLALSGGLVIAGLMDGRVVAIGGDGVPLVAHATVAPTTAPATPAPPPSAPPVVEDPFRVLGRLTTAQLGLDRPLALAIAPNGDLYVTDRSDRVTWLDPEGKVIERWGGSGTLPGQFDFSPASINENPHGSIAVGPDGTVYVSDSDNHRVQVFTADGDFIREFGSQGGGAGQFSLAFDLMADADGNVYVLDDGVMNLTKFDPTGKVLWTLPFDGSVDPVLDGHGHTPTMDAQGRIVVSIDDNGKVVYLSPDGELLGSFDGGGCDATLDALGNVYVGDCGGGRVMVYDAEGRVIGAGLDLGTNAPLFGPDDQVVALGVDGSLVFLEVTIPPAA